ncbi:hypothetical protein GOP47_0006584 [Adiantum capillus-veneris]|uniref:Arabinanase/levansucrase/invertase n=1 Tax=Adiantum capillus-veneris TaxID=13818 RepID=A0A9D4V3C7_ADICA|nr:hypothetical protein GOP47_0006584 [Adiantum capillus-veneris]
MESSVHTRLLHVQVAELKPKFSRSWGSHSLFSHRSPECTTLGSWILRFNKVFVGRDWTKFRHVIHREAHAKVTFSPIRALDSNPHDTTDCSDALSHESQHLESVESSKNTVGCHSEFAGPKLDDVTARLDSSSSNLTTEMHGFVMGLNQEAGAWDSGSIHAPVVRRYLSDNEERWMLWYSGKSQVLQGNAENESKEVMGLAISSNGVHWKRGNGGSESTELIKDGVGKVLDCSENWWAFDTEITRPSDVLVMSSLKTRTAAGVYWMYYTGGCSEEIEIPKPKSLPMYLPDFKYLDSKLVVFRTRPGLTMSHDGRNWARIEGDHYSGSLFDVGGEGEWDFLFIADPHVVYVNTDDLRLYYHSFDLTTGCFSVGYARSRDAMKWIKFGKILGGGPPGSFDELGVKSPQVVAHPSGKGFLMIYEGVASDGRTCFGLAQSKDGLSDWERCSDGPIFSVAKESNAWDSKEIHSPCLVHMDGNEWRLYYQGVSGTGKSSFGMALCTDGKLLKFKRCHGLHL